MQNTRGNHVHHLNVLGLSVGLSVGEKEGLKVGCSVGEKVGYIREMREKYNSKDNSQLLQEKKNKMLTIFRVEK